MSANIQRIQSYLKGCKFEPIFREELGWNRPHGTSPTISHRGQDYTFTLLAEKADFKVYLHFFASALPDEQTLKRLDRELDKQAAAHLTIFVDHARENQVWLWVKRRADQPAKARVNRLTKQNSGLLLAERVAYLEVSLDEEEFLSHIGVLERVSRAFDVEKITKTFYDAFKVEHSKFLQYIEHITDEDDKKWYTSIMLNRLMFIYFIQKQRWLDNYSTDSFEGDKNYLLNRLSIMQKKYGSDKFYAFYRRFLRRLFHEGLSLPESERAPELDEIIGKVPYLNGGIFDVHPLEEKYPDIQIKDEAFIKLFEFFDGYHWHLDDRPESRGNEINPDVLGYIFEKYINQKQMGAYYTKEDITSYISKNTIIPFIFTTVAAGHAQAFAANGPIWSLLRDNPDAYIYDALAHGNELFETLPVEIEAGRADITRRANWNQPADPAYALPTETWREVVARRERYAEVRALMSKGRISAINDLITYNLDIARFARDVIAGCEDPVLLRAFYEAIKKVTVLDPTCGSGAFLFAALNILKPLYHACIERMRALIPEYEQKQAALPASQRGKSNAIEYFRATLKQIDQHQHNQEYFILKMIMVNNLYGVDIMEEAIEICKLRLFLKLAAQITKPTQQEPLPDIDFNILSGNTLIGFTNRDEIRQIDTSILGKLGDTEEIFKHIEKLAEDIERDEGNFRKTQTELGIKTDPGDKRKIRKQLSALHEKLDRYFAAAQYGIDSSSRSQAKYAADFEKWQKSHRPFHWWAKFHGVMKNGGFDVIIGNPPYVGYNKAKFEYQVQFYQTLACKNLYAYVMERSLYLLHQQSRFGMIVPVSAVSGESYQSLNKLFLPRPIWISTFSNRPGKLFAGVEQRLAVFLVENTAHPALWTSPYQHWYEIEREYLFPALTYCRASTWKYTGMPVKTGHMLAENIFLRLSQQKALQFLLPQVGNAGIWVHDSPTYWVRALSFEPNIGIKSQRSDHYHKIPVRTQEEAAMFSALLSSSTFYLFYKLISNCRDLGQKEWLQIPFERPQPDKESSLIQFGNSLAERLHQTAFKRVRQYPSGPIEYEEYYPAKAKDILDEIDRVLAQHYGFTDEELDFIINYDIKYRMGRENGEESEE